ncbi:MAG: TIGR03936 family radical SAM-associated protein [Mobilitalea sp.]
MKVRIKFQKYGSMKFVGHLDVMRYLQKANRRANIDNEYTKGFSPHQIMSFAAPLGVGLTSESEYVDLQLLSNASAQEMIDQMNAVFTEGFRVIGFHPLMEQIEHQKLITAMSLVDSADYLVSLKNGYTLKDNICFQEEFKEVFQLFINQEEIMIDKKTKMSERSVNIKTMISFTAFDPIEYEEKLQVTLSDNVQETTLNSVSLKPESVADVYESGITVYMQLDTGSTSNLKPELVMEAFCNYLGIPFEKLAWQVHRLNLYTRDMESGKLFALDQVER